MYFYSARTIQNLLPDTILEVDHWIKFKLFADGEEAHTHTIVKLIHPLEWDYFLILY